MVRLLLIKADIALALIQPEMWLLLGHLVITAIADMLEYTLGMVLAGFSVELI